MPPATAAREADDQQQDQRTKSGVDDYGSKACVKMNAELRYHPTADNCAQGSKSKIADDTVTSTLNGLSHEPAGDYPDDQYDQETFAQYLHFRILSSSLRLFFFIVPPRHRPGLRYGRFSENRFQTGRDGDWQYLVFSCSPAHPSHE